MFSREFRPLKRPKLGVPDFYPQENKQSEDELSYQTVNFGYLKQPLVNGSDEFGSALKDFNQHSLNAKEYSHRVNQVLDEKKRRRWVSDSEKRKLQVSKENFFPVPLGRNRKEIAAQWFQDLAGSKPLSLLAKKVPVFNKKEEIFDNLYEKDVPISRAAWYIKMSAAYNSTMTDKMNKKKHSTDPSFSWTVSLTKYMQECVWRICNDSNLLGGRHDSHSGGRHSSTSQNTTEEGPVELHRWQYMVYLSSWLYQENLLDNHEFLKWLVERVEGIKSSDTKALQLYLPLVLKHLLDLGSCISIARSLVIYCCQRLSALFEMEQRLQKFQIVPTITTKPPRESSGLEDVNEDDSVFNDTPSVKQEVKQETGKPKSHCAGDNSSASTRRGSSSVNASKLSTAGTPNVATGNGETPSINTANVTEQPCPSYFHWCSHHQTVMLQLSCIIQTLAIKCPAAFVQVRSFTGRGSSVKDRVKANTPLSLLPLKLAELPMPRALNTDLQKKLIPALVAAEQEILQRNKSAELGWSSRTVADLQATSEGSNVQKVLKILEVLDNQSFFTSRAHNPLTVLYCSVSSIQRALETPLSDDMLTMLLCQWAVTPHRAGSHRPLVTARLLCQRQNELIKGEGWKDKYDKDSLDDSWDEMKDEQPSKMPDHHFLLQASLVKFLDKRAPLPSDMATPLKSSDPFFRLIVLFSELIRLNVFSYSMYLSTLIARGETKTPIIPHLPFARDKETEESRKRQNEPEPLSLSISLPMMKKPRLDNETTLEYIASGPTSPSVSSNFEEFGGSFSLDTIIMSSGRTDSHTVTFHHDDSGVDEDMLMRDRALKLQMLETSQLVSPLDFNSPTHAPSSPSLEQLRGDPFNNVSMSMLQEEEHVVDLTMNKHASRHLIFAAYFPVSQPHFSTCSLNERAVVLCGIGKYRHRVESIVNKVTEDVVHYFRLLHGIQTCILPESKLQDIMPRFRSLPAFEQHILATSCENILRSSLTSSRMTPGGGGGTLGTQSTHYYPACAQLVFVCELLKICGSINQLLELLVDISACNAGLQAVEERERFEAHRIPLPPPLPNDLCLPVVGILQKYMSCLLLSQQDTVVVFESLCRVLDAETMSVKKLVFLFLHHLYTNCSYLQSTYRSLFGRYLMQLGEKMVAESYPPTATESEWQRTPAFMNLTKPDECNIPQLCAYIKTYVRPPFTKTIFLFAVDVFSSAIQKSINCQTLCFLAHVCAEVCGSCGSMVNRELMGAFRAMCIPGNIMKSCHTGFTPLAHRTNILMDPGIHSNLVTFAALLITNNCFLLHDIITYIIRPILRVQLMSPMGTTSQHSSLILEFVNALILHLFVDDYIEGQSSSSPQINLPPFVQHSLQAKCKQLDLGYIVMLLKDLLRISQSNTSRGSGSKTSLLLVQPSVSENETVLTQVRNTLETLASQDWVREKCVQQESKLLNKDLLGDTSLTPSHARYLLYLLSPYTISGSASDSNQLAKMDPNMALENILKNLDQWTLCNALLHINVRIDQAPNNANRIALLDHLAAQVIQVFEDSCGDEWIGQTIECCVESGDGSYSPSVWLVTPLISKLDQTVLGRVLKSAGNVLGQGQWWNLERNQETRRSTRANSGVAPTKTGLQWQQPFLELVLACMHAQTTTHEELLGPLKNQLATFLSAFDKEGMPSDEQGKSMLYAALKLRLSLVGSMLGSICASESTTLEWVPLLMQLLCSGAVDRQTDSSELFTNCLDMLCTLLHALPSDFHLALTVGGEEGISKKSYTSCSKKLKAELNNAKSSCIGEIQQLFPLTQKSYTVTTVKTPQSLSLTRGQGSVERIKGLRVQDTKDISPWDILEGVKNSGPLMLSWFGAIRMKRKPLRYEEQRWLVRFHSHQNQFQSMMYQPHYVSLPEPVTTSAEVNMNTKQEKVDGDGSQPLTKTAAMQLDPTKPNPIATGQPSATPSAIAQPTGVTGVHPQMPTSMHSSQAAMTVPGHTQGQMTIQRAPMVVQRPMNPGMQTSVPQQRNLYQGQSSMTIRQPVHPDMRSTLRKVQYEQLTRQTGTSSPAQQGGFMLPPNPPPVYPGSHQPSQNQMLALMHQRRLQAQQRSMFLQQQQQRRVMLIRMQQQQHQQAQQRAAMQVQMVGPAQYNQYRPAVQPGTQPMQANPAMPMQQMMQQGYSTATAGGPQQTHIMMRSMGAPTQQYAQQGPGMNPTMHRQPPMY